MKPTTRSQKTDLARFRKLHFERMEPRLALSGLPVGEGLQTFENAVPSLAEIERLFAIGESPEVLLEAIRRRAQATPPDTQPTPVTPKPAVSFGDEMIAAITTLAMNQSGQTVTEFAPGKQYTLRVFVQDTRSQFPSPDIGGGVFRASVDLRFGEGVVPTGTIAFSDAFGSMRTFGTERITTAGSILENVGAVKASVFPPPPGKNTEPEWLFDAPFLVESEATAASIVTVPAQNEIESILLFGENDAINPANVSTAQLQVPVTASIDSPSPATPPPTLSPETVTSPVANQATGAPPPSSPQVLINATISPLGFRFESLNPIDDLFREDAHQRRRLDWLEHRRPDDDENDGDAGFIELEFPQAFESELLAPNANSDVGSDTTDSDKSLHEFELSELWGIADLLLEAEDLEPLLGQYRMQFRIYSPQRKPSKTTPCTPESPNSNQGMIDVAEFLRPREGRPIDDVASSDMTTDSDGVGEDTWRGSRATAMAFDLDALFSVDAKKLRLDRQPTAPAPPPRPAPDDLSTIKDPSEN